MIQDVQHRPPCSNRLAHHFTRAPPAQLRNSRTASWTLWRCVDGDHASLSEQAWASRFALGTSSST